MHQAITPREQIVFDTGSGTQVLYAARDVLGGVGNFRLWSMIGWRDVKQRYRRSTLGPFWVTISMAFMVAGLGAVYSLLFKQPLASYLPFVCLGLITWEFISRTILEGSIAFLTLEGIIKQIRLPLTTHIASMIWRNLVVLAHNMAIYIIVIVIFGPNPGWHVVWVLPGLLLVVLNLVWLTLLLASVCTRYRDVPLILQTAVQMLFFVTPIFWSSEMMPSRTILVHGNPFYHLLEAIRAPLLGATPAGETWIYLMVTLVLGWGLTFVIFTKFRRRIAYWL